MASLEQEATIKVKRDSASNWTTADSTLAAGEWGLETDTGKVKIGDGSTAWTSLEYAAETGIVATVAGKASLSTYSTGWVANSDWTNAEFTVTHNLTANLSDLIVKFFVSTDGTEANSFEIFQGTSTAVNYGLTVYQTSTSSLKIQTGSSGIVYINDSGVSTALAAQSYYYKCKVYYLS